MKRLLYILSISLATILTGCRENPADEMIAPRIVSVELSVRPDRMTAVSRTADEETLRDLNLYLYNANGEIVLHRYQSSPTLRFECLPGNYRMRIAANLGRDMGDAPASDDFTVTHADDYDTLPMSYEGDVTITSSSGGILTLPTVEVQRVVAKVSYDIAVKPADIELRSVQLRSVPRAVSVFDVAARPSDDPGDYTDCPESGISGQQISGDCYLLPNMQGTGPSITDQRQKNPDNAPANASYLLIRAVRGAKVLAYYIYLGDNNTSDFNVRANCHYRLNISILGDSEVDTRVSSYTLNVYDTYEGNTIGGYCTYDVMGELFVEVDGDPAPLTLRGHITASQGDRDRLLVDDASIGTGRDLELANQPGLNEYFLYYDLPVYTTANSQVAYTVTVEDDAGLAQSFNFRRRFANRLQVVIETADNGKGWVNVSQTLYDAEISGTRNHVVMCHEMGCTLVALPAAGYRFEGWYTTDGYTKRLSSSTTYLYIPTSNDASIYPKFTASTRPLDEDGTANCYIAPALNTSYSFDAATMGNGRSTLNITPKRLSGVSARVLWETGTLSEAIVKDVQYQDGRITFTTGTTHGNAVIGLFDASENCIWSWHIWSVDYDIEATAQTYESGAIFMDRNLGALTTDCTQPSSRGLYYQWGRKEPFLSAATCQDAVKRADAVYAAGFEYAENDPRGAESPYEVMSVAWSISHPTTYMNGVFYEEWEEWASSADWLYDHHPNLWGNVTTGKNNISRTSQKSIYDPCPPGWKIPCAEDFLGIERVSQTMPYYVTVRYNGNGTTRIPLGGTFSEGRYMANGQTGRFYTNNPYHYKWESGTSVFSDISCTSICFSSGSAPYIGTTDYYRYAANPVRCVQE